MFYFDEAKAKYPRKGILEDAISRNTIDENSYSPIIDEVWNVLYKYKDHEAFDLFPFDAFPRACSNHKDFSLAKMEESYQKSVSSENNEPTRYEMINLDHKGVIESIVKYASNIIYGWFYIDDIGARSKSDVLKTEAYVRMRDNSDSDIYVSASDLVEDVDEDTLEEVDIAYLVSRLTYYLKLIQECSIIKGVSVLQIIIEEARKGQNASLIVRDGIAKIDYRGNICDYYGPNHNTSAAWNEVWRWYTSTDRDMWGKIVDEFKSICRELKIDLQYEDYKKFTPKVVNNLLCTYLASNEEYIDIIDKCDKTVMSMLDPERLLNVRSNVPGFNQDWISNSNEFKFIQVYIATIEKLQIESETSEWKWETGSEAIEFSLFLGNNESIVTEFFSLFLPLIGIQESVKSFMSKYYYNDYGILCVNNDDGESPVNIKRQTFTSVLGFRSAPDKVCFTKSGLAISNVVGQYDSFSYCEVSDIIQLMKEGINYEYPSCTIKSL